MIAANYTADLYCDCATCQAMKHGSPASCEFVGTSWAHICRQARAIGWRISRDRERCYAPGHKIYRGVSHD